MTFCVSTCRSRVARINETAPENRDFETIFTSRIRAASVPNTHASRRVHYVFLLNLYFQVMNFEFLELSAEHNDSNTKQTRLYNDNYLVLHMNSANTIYKPVRLISAHSVYYFRFVDDACDEVKVDSMLTCRV